MTAGRSEAIATGAVQPAMPPPGRFGERTYRIVSLSLREAGIGIALVIVSLYFAFGTEAFATRLNILNMLVQLSINTVLAVGLTFVILVGGIDLSVGSILALGTVVGARIMTNAELASGTQIVLGVVACLAIGGLCGAINGVVSERWKVPSFIVTLGMMSIARGSSQVVSDNSTINGIPQGFIDMGNNILWGFVPVIFLIALLTVVFAWLVLRYTVFGRFVFAVGDNDEAVRLSGHSSRRIKIAAFTISGSLAGLAAVVWLLRLNVGSPTAGVGYELYAIAAVILGGTSLTGGKGSVIGTFLGACLLQVLDTGLQLKGTEDNIRVIVTGVVIIVAVILDAYRERLLRAMARPAA